jgi:poly(A) polymerase
MRIRYGTTADGKLIKKAEIYTPAEHGIDPQRIDPDARRIIDRLRRAGHKAYIVGGAIRDLLTGVNPKDFDIATDATPRKIRRIFPSSRQIGRRFRIVHVYMERDGERKIFEVTTFRSQQNGEDNNAYGSMEEDVWRRDFTLNALYYSPLDGLVVDFVGGYRDIREGRLRTPVPTEDSFLEDPVRMIRGVKYAVIARVELPRPMAALIRKHRHRMSTCSPARLTEEIYKILASGYAAPIFASAFRLRLLEAFLPALDRYLSGLSRNEAEAHLEANLGALDRRVRSPEGGEVNRAAMLAALFQELAAGWRNGLPPEDPQGGLMERLRQAALPLLPSRKELEQAARQILKPPRRRRKLPRRWHGGPSRRPE